jgi:hypothetical protein
MSYLDKLAEAVDTPEFARAYRRNKVRAVQETIGRDLEEHEREGLQVLSHKELKAIIRALRPRDGGPATPE